MTYRLARHVEHDPRSKGFPAETRELKTVLWAPGLVLDQGDIGSCTGNALADCLNTSPLHKDGTPFLDERAAVAIYSWATHHDNIWGHYPPHDTGSSGLAACKAGKHMGLLRGYTHAFGIEHTLGALQLQPVMIGIPWYESMFNPDGDGFLSVSGKTDDGHEVAVIGYDVTDRYATVLNSWGAGWGVNGTARLREEDLDRLLSERGDCTVPLV